MPQQLIYTSAPRGLIAGRSGYCTVARSALLREALMLQLEKFCYYQHLSLTGGRERPIFACRVVDIRGTRFHVLSRLQDAGLDFTGRTNFIAHHLVFTPEEIRQFPAPPVILAHWPGWAKSWTNEPQMLENEEWSELTALNAHATVPARTWEQVTGDSASGYGLLEARVGSSFRVDDLTGETVLALFAESLALLELREPRRDGRLAAWACTFTTSMQEQDNPSDFRWRCLHSDNPAAGRFATPDCRPLSAVRALKCTAEEAAFAKRGRQAPQIMVEPQDLAITEGMVARFIVKAAGVPGPSYQWFSVDASGQGQVLTGETKAELVLSNPPFGTTRYIVRASNSAGDAQSRVTKLSLDQITRLVPTRPPGGARLSLATIHKKSEDDIERQRQKLAAQKEAEDPPGQRQNRFLLMLATGLAVLLSLVLVTCICLGVWSKHKPPATPTPKPTTEAGQTPPVALVPPGPAKSPPVNSSNSPSETGKTPPYTFSEPSPGHLPAQWTAENIGSSSAPQSVGYDHGVFRLPAGTREMQLGAANDNFLFVSQPWSNSVELVARLPMAGKIGDNLGGIMLRESNHDDAPFVFIGCSENSVLWMQRTTNGVPAAPVNCPTTAQILYLKLVYKENNCSGFFSVDGYTWDPLCLIAPARLSRTTFLAGFAVCSGMSGRPVRVSFDNVTINAIVP